MDFINDYINVQSHFNSIFILYIIKTKNYEKYSIELMHINNKKKKIINIYKTPILSLAIDIFNRCISNSVLFMLDPKERKNWIDNYIIETETQYYNQETQYYKQETQYYKQETQYYNQETQYYNQEPRKQIKTYTYSDYNIIKLTITQEYCKYIKDGHMIRLETVIKNTVRHLYCINTIFIYNSDNFINASKAFDYVSSLNYIHELYINSLENNDMD
jgi:hypothetical protein